MSQEVQKYSWGFENYKKTPVLLSIKDSKKKVLSYVLTPEDNIEYDDEPNFAVFTGSKNNLILVDFDVNKKTNFNTSKLDGVKWFQRKFGQITDLFGLVTETPSGGVHAYCFYTDKLPDTAIGLDYKLITGEEQSVAIDILSNGGVGFQGRHYKVIKNEPVKSIPIEFLEFLRTLEYVPHFSCKNSYNSIFTLSNNKCFVNINKIPVENSIEINMANILFIDGDPEYRVRPRITLEITDNYRKYLLKFEENILDYICLNSKLLIGIPGVSRKDLTHWPPSDSPRSRFYYNSFIRYSEIYKNHSIKLKLPFKNNFPLFKVFNKNGQPLDWIKLKHLDEPPIFDYSWQKYKVRVKARCEGLWFIRDCISPTFHVTEIHVSDFESTVKNSLTMMKKNLLNIYINNLVLPLDLINEIFRLFHS